MAGGPGQYAWRNSSGEIEAVDHNLEIVNTERFQWPINQESDIELTGPQLDMTLNDNDGQALSFQFPNEFSIIRLDEDGSIQGFPNNLHLRQDTEGVMMPNPRMVGGIQNAFWDRALSAFHWLTPNDYSSSEPDNPYRYTGSWFSDLPRLEGHLPRQLHGSSITIWWQARISIEEYAGNGYYYYGYALTVIWKNGKPYYKYKTWHNVKMPFFLIPEDECIPFLGPIGARRFVDPPVDIDKEMRDAILQM
jgi:hypothetical protein